MTKDNVGKTGENFCCKFYEKQGYEILIRNYHSRYGEIDVIAQNGEYLVFCEVKTRAENSITGAAEAVDRSKKRKIMLTALDYISKNDCEKQCRFDVFEVIHKNGRIYKYRNNESAFDFDESLLRGVEY